MAESNEHIGFNVPKDEFEKWMQEREELNMSKSEYCRNMVRAGRRELNVESEHPDNQVTQLDEIEDEVIKRLSTSEPTSFEEIIEMLVGDIEDEVQEVLLENDRAVYLPKEDGYILEG